MSDWPFVALGDLCSIELGATPPRGSSRFWDPEKSTGNVWLSIADLPAPPQTVVSDSKEYLSNEGAARGKVVKEGTLLVSFKLTLGRLAYAGCDLRTNEAIAALLIKDARRIEKEYLYWYLTYFDWQKAAEGEDKVKGKTLNKEKLKVLPVLVPPLQEQRRIVAVLDEAFAAVATATANAEKNLANARELFQAELRALLEEIEGEPATLGVTTDIKVGFAFKSGGYSDDPNDIPLIRGDNVVQGRLRWDDLKRWPKSDADQYDAYRLAAGDLVLAMDRTWVKAGLKYAVIGPDDVPSLLLQRVARLRASKMILPDFVTLQIASPAFTEYVLCIQTGLGVPHISGMQIADYSFRLPDLERQSEIVDKLLQIRQASDQLVDLYRSQLKSLNLLRQSLLSQAFSGEPIGAELLAA